MKPEDVKEVLRRVDEFNAIEVKDAIQYGEDTQIICHTSLTIATKEKLISFMKNNELVSIDRDTYILKNWRKFGKLVSAKGVDSDGNSITIDTYIKTDGLP